MLGSALLSRPDHQPAFTVDESPACCDRYVIVSDLCVYDLRQGRHTAARRHYPDPPLSGFPRTQDLPASPLLLPAPPPPYCHTGEAWHVLICPVQLLEPPNELMMRSDAPDELQRHNLNLTSSTYNFTQFRLTSSLHCHTLLI